MLVNYYHLPHLQIKVGHQSHVIIPIKAEELFDKVLHSFVMRTFGQVGTEESFLKVINYIRLDLKCLSESVSTKNVQERLFVVFFFFFLKRKRK